MTNWDSWNANALQGISPESQHQAAKLFPGVLEKKKIPTARRHLNPDEFPKEVNERSKTSSS